MRRVAQIMGMPVAVDIPACSSEEVFEEVFSRLQKIDARFSPYKKGSELSLYRAKKIKKAALSPEMKQAMAACEEAEKITNGYFSAYYGGDFEPSGYVKGWAINEAGKIIEKAGYRTYCIGAGGDVLAASDSEKVWNIGIQDPANKGKILTSVKPLRLDLPSEAARISQSRERYKLSHEPVVLHIKNGAVATSGNYERGTHIINPKTKKPAAELLSATVAGPDIILADVLATATFAAGLKAEKLMKKHPEYGFLIVNKKGKFRASNNFNRSPENNP